ncbi:glycosyltransferase [Rhodoferax sp.]|uniref:glycosyltransferase family 2 protein n=1 Tax=Rhodoferax sp. TaxID=50421 RepID=UPI0026332461|nr:glycosyltransferase [Rhodoferax sp.]MDD2920295.1 glycosyltransferase [Rhodoferax sp.]
MSNLAPLVSVCIANYNGMDVIDDCLRSVLAQQGDISVEILLHDDASSDRSLDYIREHYPQVKVIASPDNVGFCIANNRMAAAAKGKYLLLLNNDAALFLDALQTLLAEAARLAKPAILTLPQFDATSGQLIDRGCLLDPFFNPVPNLDPKRGDVAMVIGACLWIPKDLWDEMEGFPEWFGSIAEDMYLCCRARLAGYPVRALSVSGYRHWQGKSFGGGKVADGRLATTFRRRALSERNKTFVMVMTCPAPWMQIMLPLHLALLVLEGTVLSVLRLNGRYLQQIYLPAVGALIQHRQELRMGRTASQNSRRIASAGFFAVFGGWPYKLRMLVRHGLPTLR